MPAVFKVYNYLAVCAKFAAYKRNVLHRKIRVGAVNYLNTKPLIYGLKHGKIKDKIQLVESTPATIALLLLKDEIDVGLVPVVIIPELKEHYIISDRCIGCDGEVGSVCLFSEVPLKNIENILLDHQSRTSVDLLKILIHQYWKINPVLITTPEYNNKQITGTTAALIIGDRALLQRSFSAYRYDLGLEWKNYTGLPFVFAAWISNKKLDGSFIAEFNNATKEGLQQLDKVIAQNPFEFFDLKEYFTNYISYQFDNRKKEGLLKFIKEQQRFSTPDRPESN